MTDSQRPHDSAAKRSSEDRSGESMPPYDPVYLHSLRELFVIVILFTIFLIWSITTCYIVGYAEPGTEPASTPLWLGMPAWAFFGVFLPWVVVDVVAVWFCFFFMQNDDLGEAHEGEDLAEQVRHQHEREAGHE
ncbi:MAG: hypothetical protein R3C99_20220 [Pirellulaceae bacterium]|nr:hypothetical protein [Planctomycetales bacterium]MCA9203372.1 hypothetical protein [Planctomycetales bacterium]MCA9219294.1 hypothetical protein [Planctomycetales bacterium]MCA9226820.1 hypothetical protein [Planctomycetales bacterium]